MSGKRSQYFETAARMDDSLLALLEEKDLEFITVKDVCARAEVGRSTFYLHYETIEDLLVEAADHLNGRFLAQFEKESAADLIARIPTAPLDTLRLVEREWLVPYLTFVQDNRRVFAALDRYAGALRFDRSYIQLRRYIFEPILGRFGISAVNRPYVLAFYLNGLLAIVRTWVRGGCAEDIERVAALMRALCDGVSADSWEELKVS